MSELTKGSPLLRFLRFFAWWMPNGTCYMKPSRRTPRHGFVSTQTEEKNKMETVRRLHDTGMQYDLFSCLCSLLVFFCIVRTFFIAGESTYMQSICALALIPRMILCHSVKLVVYGGLQWPVITNVKLYLILVSGTNITGVNYGFYSISNEKFVRSVINNFDSESMLFKLY